MKAAGIDPLKHFIEYGQDEGRQAYAAIGKTADLAAHPGFDAEYYLLSNPDVARAAIAAGGDSSVYAYQHYQTYGWKEGRNPNAVFDTKGYLNAYGDVKAAGIDPLMHYDQYGWKEGRDPSKGFDSTAYLDAYADVAKAKLDPMQHTCNTARSRAAPPSATPLRRRQPGLIRPGRSTHARPSQRPAPSGAGGPSRFTMARRGRRHLLPSCCPCAPPASWTKASPAGSRHPSPQLFPPQLFPLRLFPMQAVLKRRAPDLRADPGGLPVWPHRPVRAGRRRQPEPVRDLPRPCRP